MLWAEEPVGAEPDESVEPPATVTPPADTEAETPNLEVTAASGNEDQAIALSIDASLADTDGSESLSITASGVPSGATLSAGTDNGGGSWSLTPAQLSGLTITPPADSDADFTLDVAATSTESNGGDTALASGSINVSVLGQADTPSLTLSPASGTEDQAIALSIDASLADTDGS